MILREGHKRQIESIAKVDHRDFIYNDDVVSRFPRALAGADEEQARTYYRQIMKNIALSHIMYYSRSGFFLG